MTRRSAARRRRPQGRSRLRGLLKWSGTLACLLILLAAAASFSWEIYRGNGRILVASLAGGRFSIGWISLASIRFVHIAPTQPVRTGWFTTVKETLRPWQNALLPQFNPGYLVMPLWIPFVLIGLPTGWLWWRDRRRVPAGCCAACGYDLTGNVSGRCPECGALREVGTPKSEV